MDILDDTSEKATALLRRLGVYEASSGIWAFTDVEVASHGHVHHSQQPVALAAYAAINPTFAAGRFPGYTLIELVEKVRCMDSTEDAALAMVCQIPPPIDGAPEERGKKFGEVACTSSRNTSWMPASLKVGRGGFKKVATTPCVPAASIMIGQSLTLRG